MATSFRIENTVWGHHVYKSLWTPVMGKELHAQTEDSNIFDEFAVAVFKDGIVVGHVPRELARTCWYFLKKWHSCMICKITGHRRLSEIEGKGLIVPCVYIFTGKTKHIDKLIALCTQK